MTQYGHAGRHHGRGTPDCPRDLHHHHDERCEPPGTAELADRRQRAREAAYDSPREVEGGDVEAAIETATRVRVDDELVRAAQGEWPEMTPAGWLRSALERGFRAAGFEVEQ